MLLKPSELGFERLVSYYILQTPLYIFRITSIYSPDSEQMRWLMNYFNRTTQQENNGCEFDDAENDKIEPILMRIAAETVSSNKKAALRDMAHHIRVMNRPNRVQRLLTWL